MLKKKWKVLKSHKVVEASFFSLRADKCKLPDKRIMPKYYTIEFSDWVHVVPFTEKKQIILVEQYRHSIGKTFIEVPGGGIHSKTHEQSGKQLESPRDAARRELLEETGFAPKRMKKIGVHYPNPALQSNKIHVFLALNCKKIKEPQLDPFEDITVRLWSFSKLSSSIKNVKIKHSLMIPSVLMALKEL